MAGASEQKQKKQAYTIDKPDEESDFGGKPVRSAEGGPSKDAGFEGMDDKSDSEIENDEAPSGASPGRKRKLLLIAAPIAVVALIVTVLFYWKPGFLGGSSDNAKNKVEPVTSITRPIPIPDYREMLDFLVLNEVEGQKTLTLFRMELAFHSPKRYQAFKEQTVQFRETIYSFLQKQNSNRNTSRSWQVLVEKDLLDYLRLKLPNSRADGLKLTQLENL